MAGPTATAAQQHEVAELIAKAAGRSDSVPLIVARPKSSMGIVAVIEALLTDLDAAIAALKRVQANLKRYRASVLKAACEGTLVPTETELASKEGRSYETGQQLLTRILKERRANWEAEQLAKMLAAGKPPRNDNWKKKYKEPGPPETSQLPELPEGWIWIRAEQICGFITKGTTPSANKLFDRTGEIPFIKVYNLTFDASLDFSIDPTFVTCGTHNGELSRSRVLPSRDVLMNIVGPPLGKVSIVPDSFAEWNVNQAIAIFRPLAGVDRRYLAYLLLSENVLNWAVRRSSVSRDRCECFRTMHPEPAGRLFCAPLSITDRFHSAFSDSSAARSRRCRTAASSLLQFRFRAHCSMPALLSG